MHTLLKLGDIGVFFGFFPLTSQFRTHAHQHSFVCHAKSTFQERTLTSFEHIARTFLFQLKTRFVDNAIHSYQHSVIATYRPMTWPRQPATIPLPPILISWSIDSASTSNL